MFNNSILIVDDERSYLDLMKGLLEQEGYNNVITEDNPLKVISILEQQNIELILLDVYMPQKSGLDLLEEIYAQFPKIPVIIITAVNEVEVALKAVKLGAYQSRRIPIDYY